jgi:hypothetical protein
MSFLTNRFRFNNKSELIDPELHDCEIIGVALSVRQENKTLVVQLMDEAGVNICMTLKEAVMIYCTGFRSQNVVSYVGVYSKMDCSKELEQLEGIETTRDMTKMLNAKIMAGELGLVRVFPSVGCEIYCVCKDLEIS